MEETVSINGITYKIERGADEIRLERYNEKHKAMVSLCFPNEAISADTGIIEALSALYIERNLHNQKKPPTV